MPSSSSLSEPSSARGGCLCGAIRYEVDASLERVLMCYCVHCRKASGAAGSANVMVPTAAFRLTRGTARVFEDTADSGNILHRAFCAECGSPLYSRREATPGNTVLKAGSLDLPVGQVVANLWLQSAPPWAHPAEGPEEFQRGRDG